MSQKKSNKKAVVTDNVPSGSGDENSKIWSYIRYLYSQNKYAQKIIAQLEHSNAQLNKKLAEVA